MAHDVSFTIPWRELGKTDVEFEVWSDDEKLGCLKVSKGAVVWFPKSSRKGHKMQWSKLDALMRDCPQSESR